MGEHHARNAQQLLLPLRNIAAVALEHGVVAAFESHDEAVNVRSLRRGDDFLFGGVGLTERNVFADGAFFEPGVLQHHAVGEAERAARYARNVLALDADYAAAGVVKTHEKVNERSLAAARGTHDSHALTVLYRQREALNERLVGNVGKVNVVDFDIAVRVRELGQPLVGALYGRFQKLEHAVCGGGSGLEFGDHAGDFVERFGVLIGVGEEAGQSAYGERAHTEHALAADYQKRAEHAHRDVHDVVDKARAGVDHSRVEGGVLTPHLEFAVDVREAFFRAFFIAEQLDYALIGQHFGDEPRELAALFRLHCEHIVAALGDKVRHEQRQRSNQHHDESNQPVDRQHERERADYRDDAAEQLREALNQSVGNLVDVAAHSRHEVAVRAAVDVAERHVAKFVESVGSQVAYRAE